MKLPKTIQRFCPFCKKNNEHKITRVKTGGRRKTSCLKAGSRYRLKKLHKGYGGSPYPKIEHGVKYGAKKSQKVLIKYTCISCSKSHQKNIGRAKKFEILK
ncbi:MAG: 50S ribosomal protein L44e [Candidatus Aenigmarchaeota archaeon ex4484_52]|nr:MAG: 50S ribosomal protein L44e [Candidatus Aenigmarchaeota archaeon ex4484_52]